MASGNDLRVRGDVRERETGNRTVCLYLHNSPERTKATRIFIQAISGDQMRIPVMCQPSDSDLRSQRAEVDTALSFAQNWCDLLSGVMEEGPYLSLLAVPIPVIYCTCLGRAWSVGSGALNSTRRGSRMGEKINTLLNCCQVFFSAHHSNGLAL